MELYYILMKPPIRFPRLVAETLAGRTLVIPDSLDRRIPLIVMAFRRHAQPAVDSWLVPVSRRYADAPGFSWYELPMLGGGWRTVSGFIESGMRSGIDPAHHDRVATYYGDTRRVRDVLRVEDLDTAHAFLLDEQGVVIWSQTGWAGRRRMDELCVRIDERLSSLADCHEP